MDRLLRYAFQTVFKHGNLRVTGAGGTTFQAGDGTGPRLAVRFVDRKSQLATIFDPELRLGEAYMDGHFVMEEGSIADFLELALGQEMTVGLPRWTKPHRLLRFLAKRLQQFNPRGRSRETFLSALDLTREVLRGLGLPEREVRYTTDTFQAMDRRRLYEDYKHYTDIEKVRERAKGYAQELEELRRADQAADVRREDPVGAALHRAPAPVNPPGCCCRARPCPSAAPRS